MELVEFNYNDWSKINLDNLLISNTDKNYKLDQIRNFLYWYYNYCYNKKIMNMYSYLNIVRVYMYIYQTEELNKNIMNNILNTKYEISNNIIIRFIILLCFVNNITLQINK